MASSTGSVSRDPRQAKGSTDVQEELTPTPTLVVLFITTLLVRDYNSKGDSDYRTGYPVVVCEERVNVQTETMNVQRVVGLQKRETRLSVFNLGKFK